MESETLKDSLGSLRVDEKLIVSTYVNKISLHERLVGSGNNKGPEVLLGTNLNSSDACKPMFRGHEHLIGCSGTASLQHRRTESANTSRNNVAEAKRISCVCDRTIPS